MHKNNGDKLDNQAKRAVSLLKVITKILKQRIKILNNTL